MVLLVQDILNNKSNEMFKLNKTADTMSGL